MKRIVIVGLVVALLSAFAPAALAGEGASVEHLMFEDGSVYHFVQTPNCRFIENVHGAEGYEDLGVGVTKFVSDDFGGYRSVQVVTKNGRVNFNAKYGNICG